jgi:hypothetical protein
MKVARKSQRSDVIVCSGGDNILQNVVPYLQQVHWRLHLTYMPPVAIR